MRRIQSAATASRSRPTTRQTRPAPVPTSTPTDPGSTSAENTRYASGDAPTTTADSRACADSDRASAATPIRSRSDAARPSSACALGATFAEALDDVAARAPSLRPLADALLASDRLGAPVGPALARLAAEQRAELRRHAETHARRVPVRLLFPLVFVVLPAFGLLTVIPTLLAGLSRI